MNSRVTLTDAVAKQLSMLFEKSGQSDDYDLSTPPLPGKIMEQIFLEAMLKHVEKREVIQDPHGFTKSKFCQANLVLFCDGLTRLVDERKAMDFINPFLYSIFVRFPSNSVNEKGDVTSFSRS
ncbi:hypothetical protein DUI87_07609 [Hirundo rustica rustica]|uniref:Uncharacterized protein n=1 Tax=Hirundo rustica rustica TaxID=333673 RepID=A0A3M0KQA5_HIRRU|nr:hypothetical protein DUI87_07609 [Hirundo rustica rustica]